MRFLSFGIHSIPFWYTHPSFISMIPFPVRAAFLSLAIRPFGTGPARAASLFSSSFSFFSFSSFSLFSSASQPSGTGPAHAASPFSSYSSFPLFFSFSNSSSALRYSGSFSPTLYTSTKNSFFQLRAVSDSSRAAEMMNAVPSHWVLTAPAIWIGPAKWVLCKTVVIGWLSSPPFSGRYSEHLDNASGFPFFVPGR